jgi:cytidylate kinase
MKKKFIITIDGPAGAGKSTVSKILAKKLGYVYLDTGALYRALAYRALKSGVKIDDESALVDLCSNTKVSLKNSDGQMKVYLDGEDVEGKIRTEEVGFAASKISSFALVRQALLSLQREVGSQGGVVAEGRDMGSVVFPHADYKFFLDAGIEERIRRRFKELLERGENVRYETIREDMMRRDYQDKTRRIAPLKEPDGAVKINSDHLTVDQVVEKIMSYIS